MGRHGQGRGSGTSKVVAGREGSVGTRAAPKDQYRPRRTRPRARMYTGQRNSLTRMHASSCAQHTPTQVAPPQELTQPCKPGRRRCGAAGGGQSLLRGVSGGRVPE